MPSCNSIQAREVRSKNGRIIASNRRTPANLAEGRGFISIRVERLASLCPLRPLAKTTGENRRLHKLALFLRLEPG